MPITVEEVAPPRAHRPRRRWTVRAVVAAVALVACLLGGYRHYEQNLPQQALAYPVADFIFEPLPEGTGRDIGPDDYASLIRVIDEDVLASFPPSRDGQRRVTPFYLNIALAVTTTKAGHERVARFLREERARRGGAPTAPAPVPVTPGSF
jgi:hypothetical protein